MTQPGFWDNQEQARKLMEQKKVCLQAVDPIDRLAQQLDDCRVLLELGEDDPGAVEQDLVDTEQKMAQTLETIEFQLMLGRSTTR